MAYAAAMSATMTTPPIQNAEKFPAVRPERMLRDAPPSRLAVTTSRTWRECVEVKKVVTSGMIAPASVPQVMIDASFHHNPLPLPMSEMSTHEAAKVHRIEMIEAIQTSDVSGFSKSMSRSSRYLERAIDSLSR